MAINLQLKRETYAIPGVIVVDQQCNSLENCCPPAEVEPEVFDCEDPDIGELPQSVVITLSGATGSEAGLFSAWESFSSSPTLNCSGEAWTVGALHWLSAFPNGSVGCNYLGLFSASDIANYSCGQPIQNSCDHHVYVMSFNEVVPGDLGGTPLDASVFNPGTTCCCDVGPHLYLDRVGGTYSFQYTTGRSLCAQQISSFSVPCSFDEIQLLCFGASEFHIWYAKSIIDDCVGVACEGGTGIYLPQGDVLGGLYCNAGTIAQYPTRFRMGVYRQAFLLIPQATDMVSDCCLEDAIVMLHTYLVRRRWYNDGVSDIIAEPTVYSWSQRIPITFVGNGTIQGSGTTTPGCELGCDLQPQTVDIDPGA